MGIIRLSDKPENLFFSYDHWRFCKWCGRCHSEKYGKCKRYEENRTRYYCPNNNLYDRDNFDEDFDDEVERFGNARSNQCHIPVKQKHVHEFEGSAEPAEFGEDVHNHRLAGVSGEAINVPGGHIHKIRTRTDFFNHYHFINKLSGLQKPVDGDKENGKPEVKKHIHFVEGLTSENDGHMHSFEVATLIESPLLPEADEDIR